ncbi:MAG: GNAT family N-acetyltransferase [Paenirhodobacter sp.]|uniref:GNAT family N-acetyltransferase n=1 Tax=Paenirhodobacter sp. TaxID=1965326 RepID=UPI003D0E6337
MSFTFDIPTVETERLILRAPHERDFPTFAEFYASDRASFVGGPISPELSWRMLAMETGHWALRGYGRWIAEEKATGATVGMIGLFNPEGWPEIEIGWDLFNGFEGRGFATEAGRAARRYAYEVVGLKTVMSLVKPPNLASARVAERLGCVREGTFLHERHGPMNVWRHPTPAACKGEGA